MNKHATQGKLAIEELRKRPLTYAQMNRLGLGNSVWRRVAESMKHYPGHKLVKVKHASGYTAWRVVPNRWGEA